MDSARPSPASGSARKGGGCTDKDRSGPHGSDIRAVYARWLREFDWQTFGTLTFRKPRSVRRARELVGSFFDSDRPSSVALAVWGSEPHQSGNGHSHVLIKWHPWVHAKSTAFHFSAEWRRKFGHCWLYPFDPERGAVYYITKYVIKESMTTDHWGVWAYGREVVECAEIERAGMFGGAHESGVRREPDSHAFSCWRGQEEAEEALDKFQEEVKDREEAYRQYRGEVEALARREEEALGEATRGARQRSSETQGQSRQEG